ncbi:MAG: hypothetical protein Q4F17_05295 [Eubacteriales bacterium]|nr:hypothetical protein [Eubacteriales bacterium]
MNANDLMDLMESARPQYVMEAQRHREAAPARRRPTWKVAVLVAAAALTMMGCAIVYTMKDLKMGERTYELPGEPAMNVSILSLQGYKNSPGYKANLEWSEFKKNLDVDYAYYSYHHFEVPEAYAAYNCKTQEEMDKVDEICKKYKLNPIGKSWNILDASKIFEATGIKGIQKEGTAAVFDLQAGGCRANGSFGFRGGVTFPGQEVGDMLNYDVIRKDSFDFSSDTVSDLDSFDDWTYTTTDGVELLMANYSDDTFMFADLDDYFIRVRLFGEENLPVDSAKRRKELEARAECFDFTIQPGRVDEGVLEKAEQDYWDLMEELEAGYAESYRVSDYSYIFKNNAQYMNTDKTYALADLNGDGLDELILTDIFGGISDIVTYNGKETSLVVQTRTLSQAPFMEEIESKFWIAEDSTLVEEASYGKCRQYAFFKLDNGAYKLTDLVEYHDEAPAGWSQTADGKKSPLTDAEAKAILDGYKPMNLDFKPTSQFPMD